MEGGNEILEKALIKDIDRLKTRLSSIESKYIDDDISKVTYRKLSGSAKNELLSKETELETIKKGNKNMLDAIQKNKKILESVGALFEVGTTENKIQLINLVFSSEITIKNYIYETPNVNAIFKDNLLNCSKLSINKNPLSKEIESGLYISTLDYSIMKLKGM